MREVYIRKMRYDEARFKLERELHQAFMDGETVVEIVHGIGEGILKKMAMEFVESSGFLKLSERSPLFDNPGTTRVEVLGPPGRSVQ